MCAKLSLGLHRIVEALVTDVFGLSSLPASRLAILEMLMRLNAKSNYVKSDLSMIRKTLGYYGEHISHREIQS